MKRILSIDGGGIRGVFPAAVLAELEDDLDQPIGSYFDLIAGTSTGGILALGLGLGLRARSLLELYENNGPEIFGDDEIGTNWIARQASRLGRRLMRNGRFWILGPKHSSEPLRRILSDVLGERRLGDATTRLMIPAWHGKSNDLWVFKTPHHERLATDYKDLAVDVAMSTAAAPAYFERHVTARDVGLVDGGIWANNPTGPAVVEAIGVLDWKPKELRILSLGCLDDITEMRERYSMFGIAPRLSEIFLAGQSRSSIGTARILTGDVGGSNHKAVYRISQPVPANTYSLDRTSKIQDLKDRGIAAARTEKPNLRPVFFQKQAEPFVPIYILRGEA